MRNLEPANWWVQAEWPIWRVVTSQIAGIEEIERSWTLDDVFDANEALDVVEDVSTLRSIAGRPPPRKDDAPKRPKQGTAVARNTRPRPPRSR